MDCVVGTIQKSCICKPRCMLRVVLHVCRLIVLSYSIVYTLLSIGHGPLLKCPVYQTVGTPGVQSFCQTTNSTCMDGIFVLYY